jgi:hypothetical protein
VAGVQHFFDCCPVFILLDMRNFDGIKVIVHHYFFDGLYNVSLVLPVHRLWIGHKMDQSDLQIFIHWFYHGFPLPLLSLWLANLPIKMAAFPIAAFRKQACCLLSLIDLYEFSYGCDAWSH